MAAALAKLSQQGYTLFREFTRAVRVAMDVASNELVLRRAGITVVGLSTLFLRAIPPRTSHVMGEEEASSGE